MSKEDGWQPIETAPRDGRTFLVYHVGDYWGLCYWSDLYECFVQYWDGEPVEQFPPRWWQPLPTPPSETT